MKKIVSALLFCALLLSLAACSQKSPTAQETEPESSAAVRLPFPLKLKQSCAPAPVPCVW